MTSRRSFLRTARCLALIVAYYVLAVVVTGIVLLWSTFLCTDISPRLAPMPSVVGVSLAVGGIVQARRRRAAPPKGIPLAPEQQPWLHEFASAALERSGQSAPTAIQLGALPTVAVTAQPRRKLRRRGPVLTIGAPLLQFLDQTTLEVLLAREAITLATRPSRWERACARHARWVRIAAPQFSRGRRKLVNAAASRLQTEAERSVARRAESVYRELCERFGANHVQHAAREEERLQRAFEVVLQEFASLAWHADRRPLNLYAVLAGVLGDPTQSSRINEAIDAPIDEPDLPLTSPCAIEHFSELQEHLTDILTLDAIDHLPTPIAWDALVHHETGPVKAAHFHAAALILACARLRGRDEGTVADVLSVLEIQAYTSLATALDGPFQHLSEDERREHALRVVTDHLYGLVTTRLLERGHSLRLTWAGWQVLPPEGAAAVDIAVVVAELLLATSMDDLHAALVPIDLPDDWTAEHQRAIPALRAPSWAAVLPNVEIDRRAYDLLVGDDRVLLVPFSAPRGRSITAAPPDVVRRTLEDHEERAALLTRRSADHLRTFPGIVELLDLDITEAKIVRSGAVWQSVTLCTTNARYQVRPRLDGVHPVHSAQHALHRMLGERLTVDVR